MKSIGSFRGANIQCPDYEGRSIAQLPGFFSSIFDDKIENPLKDIVSGEVDLDGVKNVIFLLVDGFGANHLRKYSDEHPVLQRFKNDGHLCELDSVFPSCTPNALNTLNANGLTPAQHGLIDWWLYSKELNEIIATLPFSAMGDNKQDSLVEAGIAPSFLLDSFTTYQKLEEQGIKTFTFLPQSYVNSAYSSVAYKGSELIPYTGATDLFEAIANNVGEFEDRSYSFVYWNQIDSAAHHYGPDSPEHQNAIHEYFTALDNFMKNFDDMTDTLFVISADHGQVNVDPDETFYLDTIPGLVDLFQVYPSGEPILPWGAQREVFLAIKDGKQQQALELLQAAIGEHVELLESSVAFDAGLFGGTLDAHPEIRSRIGDIIVLPKANKTVWYHHPGEEDFSLKGQHGGLSSDEIKVPFGLLRLN